MTDTRVLMQNAFLQIEKLQTELTAYKRAQSEPIAVVGMACRFPGEVNTPDEFWQLLAEGRDAITEIPADRWNVTEFYDPNPATPGKMTTRWGGFIDPLREFDASFFSLSPREAISLDPQHRLLLEVTWEALEHAGIAPDSLFGTSAGVFIGIGNSDYQRQLLNRGTDKIDAYLATGNASSVATGRLSYFLGVTGPSIAIETACSSSLVTIHLACQSLRQKECQVAVAGGVSLMLSPEWTINFSQAQMLAPDGRCKTFDAAANGYVRSEGCGMVVLKRLSTAQADGDNILAVIRGSAINQDGRSSGLTAPNGPSQEAVIRQALDNAKVKAEQVSYVEAHGTGTQLGDPIEARTLGAVYGRARQNNEPLKIGSVKTNIGHLEFAAGVAGLMKVILAFQHEMLPAHLHFKQPNPHLNWPELGLQVVKEAAPWPRGAQKRLAGVSSFGFSGTNAHVILESYELGVRSDELKNSSPERPMHLLALSAKTSEALRQLTRRYADYAATHPQVSLADMAYSANTGRAHFDYRAAIVATDLPDLQAKLRMSQTSQHSSLITHHSSLKIVFLFTGQGSQYIDMGRQLYETQPIFRQALDRCAEILAPYMNIPLLNILYPNGQPTNDNGQMTIDQTAYTQPALFALEYALTELWSSWGIKPDVVMGHSVGEYVAACVAGVFSLEDGLKLIAQRGRLMQNLPAGGEMVTVFATETEVMPLLAPYQSRVAIAAFNAPQQIVISGAGEAIQAIVAQLTERNIKTKALAVSHAFHSPLMQPMLAEFERVAATIQYTPPRLPLISNVTGQRATAEIATPAYWVRHISQPVKFSQSMQTLADDECNIFIEIGPKPTLISLSASQLVSNQQTADKLNTDRLTSSFADRLLLASLRPNQSDWSQMLSSLGALYERGVQVDWRGFDQPYSRQKVTLPTYPFQRHRYWAEREESKIEREIAKGQKGEVAFTVNQLTELLQQSNAFSSAELALLPKLVAALQQQTDMAWVQDYCYELQWQSKTSQVSNISEVSTGQKWLIIAADPILGAALARQLEQAGQYCVIMDAASLRPNRSEEKWHGVVYLPTLSEITNATNLMATQSQICNELLLASQLVSQSASQSVSSQADKLNADTLTNSFADTLTSLLWVVTQNAMPVLAEQPPLNLHHAPLWGMGRVMALEQPQIWGGLIDIDSAVSVEALVAELLQSVTPTPTLSHKEREQNASENQIALRNGQRYVARLSRSASQQSAISNQADTLNAHSYLITGGFGALGLQVARWLVSRGAKHLALTGRRGAVTAEAQQFLADMAAQGVQVTTFKVDVTDETAMREMFQQIKKTLPPLRGIVHTAGIAGGYQPLAEMDEASLVAVLQPKVMGGWLLHQLTQDITLDFFVNFSSIAAMWGSKGQGHYAAANLFLDNLAHYRRQLGQTALSINWGPWAEGGMATAELQTLLGRMGVKLLSPSQALAALEYLLQKDVTQQTVVDVDWSRFIEIYQAQGRGQFFELLQTPPPSPPLSQEGEVTTAPNLRQQLAQAPSRERLEILQNYVAQETKQVLAIEATQSLNPQQGFFDLGMDSLMAVELKNRLERGLGTTLPATVAFEYPSVAALTTYLSHELGLVETSPSVISSTPTVAVTEIEQLSEAELNAMLEEELAFLKQ